jgi:hypothetical protein
MMSWKECGRNRLWLKSAGFSYFNFQVYLNREALFEENLLQQNESGKEIFFRERTLPQAFFIPNSGMTLFSGHFARFCKDVNWIGSSLEYKGGVP